MLKTLFSIALYNAYSCRRQNHVKLYPGTLSKPDKILITNGRGFIIALFNHSVRETFDGAFDRYSYKESKRKEFFSLML